MASVQKLNTVLYEVQQACILLALTPPVGVYDSQDETAQMMGAAVNIAGIMVNDAHDWQHQRLPIAFAGDGVQTAFDLPENFARFVDGTGWSSATKQPVVVLNSQQWAAAQAWVGAMYISPACRIVGNQLVFMRAPAVGDTVSFEYISAHWVQDAVDPLIFKQYASRNADQPLFDWLLMVHAIRAKWLELKAMDNSGALADFNERLAQVGQNTVIASALSLNGGSGGGFRYVDGIRNVPDTGFGA